MSGHAESLHVPGDDVLAETLLELLRIPSPTGGERPLRDHLARRLRASLGDRARLWALHDGLVVHTGAAAPHPPTEPRPSVALVGHLDVVEASHRGPPRREGDRIFGPGASDMKAGLALMVLLAEALARVPGGQGFDLWLVFYAREEGPYEENMLAPLLDEVAPLRSLSLAICLEPTDNELQLGCVGSLHVRATVRGRSAHSARPWDGENAIERALPLLDAVARWPAREVHVDGLRYREVLSATLLRAGHRRNVVPDRLQANLNYRFAPGRSPDEAFEELQGHLGDLADGLEAVDRSPSARPHRDSPLVARLERCGVRAVRAKQAWTDVARFDALGVPAVNLGPGAQGQAHQPDEWVSLAAMRTGYRILARFLRSMP